jgi:hypothetical protein
MNRQQIIVDVAAVLSTLLEMPDFTGIASMVYLALGADMERYRLVSRVMAQAGWVDVTAKTIKLTDAGVLKARAVNAAVER